MRHPENISDSKKNSIINIEFQNSVSEADNAIAYIAVISEKLLAYDIVRNDLLLLLPFRH